MGGGGVLDRERNAAERRVVQHEVHRAARAAAGIEGADVAFDETEVVPFRFADRIPHLGQVLALPRSEIVQPDHPLVEPQQGFEQVRADEAGDSGHQPRARARGDALQHTVVHSFLPEYLSPVGWSAIAVHGVALRLWSEWTAGRA